jgi:ribosomal protein S18 acetylase RimI-like enzyme
MRIRRLAPPDRAAIAGLLRSDGTFREDEVSVALELIDGAIAEPDGDYRALVAELDRTRVVGYVCYGPTPMTVGTYDLYWLATHRDARGRGVASGLVQAMEDELRGAGARTIRVETSELEAYGAARRFYSRLAYDEAGRIPDFYRQGDDLLILMKRLDAVARGEFLRGSAKLA